MKSSFYSELIGSALPVSGPDRRGKFGIQVTMSVCLNEKLVDYAEFFLPLTFRSLRRARAWVNLSTRTTLEEPGVKRSDRPGYQLVVVGDDEDDREDLHIRFTPVRFKSRLPVWLETILSIASDAIPFLIAVGLYIAAAGLLVLGLHALLQNLFGVGT